MKLRPTELIGSFPSALPKILAVKVSKIIKPPNRSTGSALAHVVILELHAYYYVILQNNIMLL